MPAYLHQKEEVERFGKGSADPFGAPDTLINTVVINLKETHKAFRGRVGTKRSLLFYVALFSSPYFNLRNAT
jgi:hypothetical protein